MRLIFTLILSSSTLDSDTLKTILLYAKKLHLGIVLKFSRVQYFSKFHNFKFKTFKYLINYYIWAAYRLNFKVSLRLTSRYPGNGGFRFSKDLAVSDSHRLQPVGSPTKYSHSTLATSNDEMQSAPQADEIPMLKNVRILLLSTDIGSSTSSLLEIASESAITLRSLGADCEVHSLAEFKRLYFAGLMKMSFDSIVVDSHIKLNDLKLIKSISKEGLGVKFIPKILMFCYDLWRLIDESQVRQSQSIIHTYLHQDNIAVSKTFSDIKSKFRIWPFVRAWNGIQGTACDWNKADKRIFFSGSVSEVDRRDLLNFVIDETRKTPLKPKFVIATDNLRSRFPNRQKYIDGMRQNKYILSPTQKKPDHWIITGRAIEALRNPGFGILINQEGPSCRPLAEILTPFDDYLPFTNEGELKEILIWCMNNPSKEKTIGSKAHIKLESIFNPYSISEPFL